MQIIPSAKQSHPPKANFSAVRRRSARLLVEFGSGTTGLPSPGFEIRASQLTLWRHSHGFSNLRLLLNHMLDD